MIFSIYIEQFLISRGILREECDNKQAIYYVLSEGLIFGNGDTYAVENLVKAP